MKKKSEVGYSKPIENDYNKFGIDQLLIYCANKIIEKGQDCTFEALVYECFTLFPKKFGLVNYPHWPDSSRVDKSWRRCRTDRGWLSGTVKEGFKLTKAGKEVAAQVEKKLFKKKENKFKKNLNKGRTREEAIIKFINETREFQKYLKYGPYQLSEVELRSFLGGTLETPKRILVHNFHIYYQTAERLGEKEIISFLKICKKSLKNLGG